MMGMRCLARLSMVALAFLCGGCWDAHEINELGIVVASGAELARPRDPHSPVLAYMQVARPGQLQGGPGGMSASSEGGDTFVLEKGAGPTAASALAVIQKRMSRRFFLRDRRIVIFGEDYARRGTSDALDEMLRNPDARLRAYVLVAHHCRPSDILKLSYPLSRLPVDALVALEQSHQAVTINAVQFAKMLTSKSDAYAMGIHLIPSVQSPEKQTFELDDVAVFKRDRLVGWLNREQSQGFYWIEPQARLLRADSLSVPLPVGGWLTSQLFALSATSQSSWTPNGPRIQIRVEATDDVLENESHLSLDQPQDLRQAEQAIKRTMLRQIHAALDALQRRYRADCLGFGNALFATHPNEWRRIEPHWEDVYSRMPVAVSVQVRIARTGLTGESLYSVTHPKRRQRVWN